MEEIKVEDYVRTKRGIAKVLEVKTVQPKMYGKHDKAYLIDKCPRMYITETEFLNHSKNITDLIEIGDILEIKEGNDMCYLGLEKDTTTVNYTDIKEIIENKECELLSILTHEQFEQNSYKV